MEDNTVVVEPTEPTPAPVEPTEPIAAEPVEPTGIEPGEPGTEPVEPSGEVEFSPEQQELLNQKIAAAKHKERRKGERATQDAEYWRQQAQTGQPQQPAAPAEPQAPVLENFDTYDDFIVAKAEFAAESKFKSMQSQQVQKTQQDAYASKKQTVVAKGSSEHEDFYEVVHPNLPVSEYAMMAVTELDNGSEALYYLGKNPAEAARINGLGPAAQMIEITNISNKLAATPTPKQTNAPTPVTPVTTTGPGTLSYHPDMSDADFNKWRRGHKER